ncbi:MAG TPA: glycosyltransferase family 2 protein [Candidatus Bathyarchaeia archaeon]|nr:glycosyltransferase family 2 protein [Candidatus Bathyarchaeia archaeon]
MSGSRSQVLNQAGSPIASVIVPAYREEEFIEATLAGIVEEFRSAKLSLEVIVVVDIVAGDSTASHIRKVANAYPEIRLIERHGRRGVGDAIRTGIREAKGHVVIPVMGDQSERPSDIVRLVKKAGCCDIVFTNRFMHGRPAGYPVVKYVTNRCCNVAAMLLFHIPYSDITNAFKAYKRELLNQVDLSSNGFEIFLEMPIRVMMLNAFETSEIETGHIVRKKRAPKLSVIREGWRYARVLVLLRLRLTRKESEEKAR